MQKKLNMTKPRPRGTEFPIFPIRMRPDDRKVFQNIKKRFNLRTEAEAVRVAGRVVEMMEDLTYAKVVYCNTAYQVATPDALVIAIPPEQEPAS